MSQDDLAAALSAQLDGATIADLQRLSGGASRETWQFTADGQTLILQRQRSGDVRDMATEVDALRAAAAVGVPVAKIVAASNDAGALGAAFMVLTHVPGETIARKILRDDEFATARQNLTRDCAAALARLHTIDPADVPGAVEMDQMEQYRAVLDGVGAPHPTFELAFRWLDEHRPPAGPTRVVHGDFRLGNLMVDRRGLAAVLDWELVHLGDPMEDLGWMCVKAWRFGSPYPVAGVGQYEELIDAYAAAAGYPVDVEVVRWWEVLGTLKWGIMCIMQAQSHLTGAARSHELAAIGRRVCENEHDLFLALQGRW